MGFANADARVAEGDLAIKQCIQHLVAEQNLTFPHGKAVLRKNASENLVGLPMGFLLGRNIHIVFSQSRVDGKLMRRRLSGKPAPHGFAINAC